MSAREEANNEKNYHKGGISKLELQYLQFVQLVHLFLQIDLGCYGLYFFYTTVWDLRIL